MYVRILCMYLYIIYMYIHCVQLIDGSYVPEESVTPVKDDAIDDEVTLPVETVQASSPANVTSNGHLTDDEVIYVPTYIRTYKLPLLYVRT